MRVLHFTKRFSPTSETFIYDYIMELERQGVDNHVATLRRLNEESRPFPKVTKLEWPSRWDPRRLWRFGRHLMEGYSVEKSKTISAWPQVRKQLAAVVRHIQPDIIHAQFGTAGALIGPVAQALETPLMVSFHGYDVSALAQENFWVQKYQVLFEQADALHAVSSHIGRQVEKLGGSPNHIYVVHNGIKLKKFENFENKHNQKQDESIRCLHVGRLVEKKAPMHLIRAFKKAKDRLTNIDINLIIAGDGPLRRDSERKAKKMGIDGCVSFEGRVPHEKVPRLMARSDIYTMHCMTASNGDQEGMGVVFAEASAMELPIVTTRHNGIPDVVLDGETGFLVSEKDVTEMGKKIAELSRKKRLRRKLGKKGKKHIEKNFNIKNQVGKMKEVYSNISKIK